MATPQHRMPNIRPSDGPNRSSARQPQEGNGTQCGDGLYEQAEHVVRDNIGSAAMVTFGLGLALGTALVWALGPSRRKTAGFAPWGDLRDAVSHHLPDALARYVSKS